MNDKLALQGMVVKEKATAAKTIFARDAVIHLHRHSPFETAYNAYRRYLAQHDTDAGMWGNLGALLRQHSQPLSAIGCYQRALSLKPDDPALLTNLGNACKDVDRLDEAVACQRRAHTLSPDNALIRLNLAVALREAMQFAEARQQLDSLLAAYPDNAAYRWERAIVNLHLGDFAQGWQDYEARWHTGELPALDLPFPRWQGEALDGKHLLLVAEQGYGDTMLAARFIPVLQKRYPACQITLLCKPALHRLFAALGVALITQYNGESCDAFCPLMSLMGVLGIDDTNVPPPATLHVPAAAQQKFAWLKDHAKGRRKIGIVWSGSETFKDNAKRAVGIERFLQLATQAGIQLYSFQKGSPQRALHEHAAVPLVCDLSEQLDDFADTAAAVAHMDMVIMTDSSLAHLAASLNRPVLNLLQYKPYWLYQSDARLRAWYPAMRAARQKTPGDWDGVFAGVGQLLRALCSQVNGKSKEKRGL